MSSATSKISSIGAQVKEGGFLGWGGVSKLVFVSTKVTKTKDLQGNPSYELEVIQYDDAKGTNPKTIATGYTYKNAARRGDGDQQLGGDDFTRTYLEVSPDIKNSNPTLADDITGGKVNRLVKQQLKTDPGIKALAQTPQERDTLDAVTGSSNRENPNQTGGDTSTPAPGVSSIDTGTAKARTKNYPLNLSYPLTLEPKNQDTLKIDVLKFVPRKRDALGFADRPIPGRVGEDGGRQAIGSVILPVTQVADKNQVGWGGEKMSALDVALAGLALGTIDKGGEGFETQAKAILDSAGAEQEGIKKGVAAYFAQAATGTRGLLARTEGAIINPNFELLFNGPKLRSFAFTYRMSARSEPETQTIMQIIRMFKQSMAVQRSTQNLFLKAPNTYKLTFRKSESAAHDFLPKVKECALTNFNVNYVPDGTYATFENSSMVAYELQFQFSELEPIYNDDYTTLDGDADTQIGY